MALALVARFGVKEIWVTVEKIEIVASARLLLNVPRVVPDFGDGLVEADRLLDFLHVAIVTQMDSE